MKILCEKRKETLNLTISVLITKNDKSILSILRELQINAIKRLSLQSRIGTYIYPQETLHFSVFNLTSFDLDVDFNSARNFVESQGWFNTLRNFIGEKLIQLNNKNYDCKIIKFYIDTKDKEIKNSLTLNLKSDDLIKDLNEIEKSIKEKLYDLGVSIQNFGIQDNNVKLFRLNILRFFGEEKAFLEGCNDFYKFIEEENLKLDKNPLNVKIAKFCFVISDSYLSNSEPCISHD